MHSIFFRLLPLALLTALSLWGLRAAPVSTILGGLTLLMLLTAVWLTRSGGEKEDEHGHDHR